MLTDFGKMVKKLMVDEGINQRQLAQDLGISPAILSNYMTGKNIPEMETIEKCIKRFKLQRGAVKDIFSKAFSSTAKSNHKIILDTRYFDSKRLDLLAQAIVVLMIYPDNPSKKQEPFDFELAALRSHISDYFKNLDIESEYQPPVLAGYGSDIIS
ncbi:MAG: helix-turn-helix transcriptional regulator [Spirochaetaceae bacterium]|jgi:transcriptional regulator with XRE-family HTH domain|nr:helix-turn-helix transcriptional regulator [Spirochaetaceae bacterium]